MLKTIKKAVMPLIKSKVLSKDPSYCLSLNQLQGFEAMLNRCNYSVRQFRSILDFGCGYGRLTRHLFKVVADARIYGCEIQRDLVDKCIRVFPRGVFIKNDPTPPINFSDNMFDLIFSYSVFTHLSERNHIAWLKELARILKPGGVMVHSTHGYECLKRINIFSPKSSAKYATPHELNDLMKKPVCYHWVVDNPLTPEYGLAIISKDYVMQNWQRYSGLNLAAYEEGAIEASPEGCQDLVLLVKK